MNNDTEEPYCSFRVSKLLKEKGFKVPCLLAWDDEDGHLTSSYVKNVFTPLNYNVGGGHKTSKPTHALAIEWIRVNFGIWTEVKCLLEEKNYWVFYLTRTNSGERIYRGAKYNSPQEATEAALLHTLQNFNTMNKEFVSYEIALALKEIGFDEPCLASYGYNAFTYNPNSDTNHPSLIIGGSSHIGITPRSIPAPLYQQAFLFFREKYGISSWISTELGFTSETYCWQITGDSQSSIYKANFKSYEEAELACLDKLIELVKQKL